MPSPPPTAGIATAVAVADTAGLVAEVRSRAELARQRRPVHVSLAGMGLASLPVSAIAVLGTIEELDLSRNALVELPAEITRVPGLVALDLSDNRLARVPESLPALRYLNVQGNEIRAITATLPTSLETLYVDRIAPDDVPVLLAMSSLQSIGVIWTKAHAMEQEEGRRPYHEISLSHAWRSSTFVAADAPGDARGAREGSRVFLAAAKSDVRLASDEAPGAGTCGRLALATLRGLEPSALAARVEAQCAPLFSWSPQTVEPVRARAYRVTPTPTDGCDGSRREFELHATVAASGWFLASSGAPPRKPTIPAAKTERVSKGMTLTSAMTIPPGFAMSSVRWFVHPEGAAQLALVRARGFGGDEMPLKRMEWTGLFLVGDRVTRLAESDPYATCEGAHLFELGGFLDYGGDGDLDLVLLGDTPMLLERVEGGYVTHAPMRVPCRC